MQNYQYEHETELEVDLLIIIEHYMEIELNYGKGYEMMQ